MFIYSQDLQKIMDEAKHGVIYFSMGSNAKSTDWPDVLKKDFLELFSGLKQTVLWKFEEHLPNLPKNVHILNWAPQQSILGETSTSFNFKIPCRRSNQKPQKRQC